MFNNSMVSDIVTAIILVSLHFFVAYLTFICLYLFWTLPIDKTNEDTNKIESPKTKSMKRKRLILNIAGYSLTGIYFLLFVLLVSGVLFGWI